MEPGATRSHTRGSNSAAGEVSVPSRSVEVRCSHQQIDHQDHEHRRHESAVPAVAPISIVGSTPAHQQKQQKNQYHGHPPSLFLPTANCSPNQPYCGIILHYDSSTIKIVYRPISTS